MLPKLYSHFQDLNFPDLLWIHKWFQTIFLYSFPFKFCIRVWDCLLADGTKFLFQISLAILFLAAEELLELDFGGINDYFKALQDDNENKLMSDVELIIAKAYTIKIDDKRINDIIKKIPQEKS